MNQDEAAKGKQESGGTATTTGCPWWLPQPVVVTTALVSARGSPPPLGCSIFLHNCSAPAPFYPF